MHVTPGFRMGRLDHVHIRVPDRAAAAEWYATHLGFEPVEAYEFWAKEIDGGPLQISADGGRSMLALFEANDFQPMIAQQTGVAFSVDADDFISFSRALPGEINGPQGTPLTLHDLIDFDLCWAFNLADPWGNQYELNCYDYGQVKQGLVEVTETSPVRYWPHERYEQYVGTHNTAPPVAPFAEIANTLRSLPDVLNALLRPIAPATLRTRPEENEWCALEVIGHLIACDSDAFRNRITGIVDGNPRIAGFDAWEAINARDFADESLGALVAELAQERSKSCDLIMSLSATDLAKTALFEDGRRFAASDFVHEWPFHDQDHLQQILASLKLAYLSGMTPVMRGALTDS